MTESFGTYGQFRKWERLPAILVWGTLIFSLLTSFFYPVAAIIFIILFDVYWLLRVFYFVIYLLWSWRQYHQVAKVPWMQKVRELPQAAKIYHLIFLPTVREEVNIIRTTLTTIRECDFPNDRIMIVLAGEERMHEEFQERAAIIQKEFAKSFFKFIITEHPKNLPDEIPGKGSNLHYSAHQVKRLLEEEEAHISPEHIVVSSFDVDTVVHPSYFAYLTYLYVTTPNPTRASYQPVALFSNNIWSAKAPVRVAAFGTTFWLLTELARPERSWTFSSHSMPWKMLLDVGFWQKDIVSEDSRIFLQAFVHYDGDYRVIPLFLPVSMDTVTGETYMESLKALYKQLRRWAWGVENLPVMIERFRENPRIPFRKKFRHIFNYVEGMYTWATAPLLIFFLGWLPLWFAKEEELALVSSAPFTLEWLMRLATIGVFVSGLVALTMLPPRPKTIHASTWFVMIFQWALLPFTFILFGAIPAIDAQTRLFLGKYLGFNVTKKKR